ncbi:hypothetical protein JCM3770_006291 [Rhodotorula araucariae]
MRARPSRRQTVALRWVFRALFALVVVYIVQLWYVSPLGPDVYRAAHVPGATVEVLGIGRHSATVIFVHGLAGNAAQTIPLVSRLRKTLWQVSFLLPSATFRPLTAKNGADYPAWFDIENLQIPLDASLPDREDEEGLAAAVERIHALVQGELDKGIDPDRIVLAGFSQGCATALISAISSKEKLGGVACLSGWLPLSYKIKKIGRTMRHPLQSDHAHELPVFWGHGAADPTVPYRWADESIAQLTKLEFRSIEFHTYDWLEHDISRPEEEDLAAWLERLLPPT